MTVIVIAVNALEAQLVEQFDLPNLLLNDNGRLSIPEGYPLHTEVLWPSIITGKDPEEHGLTRTSAREWGNPLLQTAADIGLTLVPEEYLLPIGKRLQKLGFEREAKAGEAYYDDRGITTIFTGRRSEAIDVPGYSQWDDADDIRELMGHDDYEPDDHDLFVRRTQERFDKKRRLVSEALDEPNDIVMAYFQTLDNIQHVYWSDAERIAEWYETFDEFMAELRAQLAEDDVLIVMSDHGMEEGPNSKGEHSDHGYYASTSPLDLHSIIDLKSAIDTLLGSEQ